MWVAVAYIGAGFVAVLRKGWAMTDPKMRDHAWWVQ